MTYLFKILVVGIDIIAFLEKNELAEYAAKFTAGRHVIFYAASSPAVANLVNRVFFEYQKIAVVSL